VSPATPRSSLRAFQGGAHWRQPLWSDMGLRSRVEFVNRSHTTFASGPTEKSLECIGRTTSIRWTHLAPGLCGVVRLAHRTYRCPEGAPRRWVPISNTTNLRIVFRSSPALASHWGRMNPSFGGQKGRKIRCVQDHLVTPTCPRGFAGALLFTIDVEHLSKTSLLGQLPFPSFQPESFICKLIPERND